MTEEKQIQNVNQLTEVIADSIHKYESYLCQNITHSETAIQFSLDSTRGISPGSKKKPFNDLLNVLHSYMDKILVYRIVLEEYSSRTPREDTKIPIPREMARGELYSILEKHKEDPFMRLRLEGEEIRGVIDNILKNALEGADKLELDFPFIQNLRNGSYQFPLLEDRLRNRVIKELTDSTRIRQIMSHYSEALKEATYYSGGLLSHTIKIGRLIESLPKLTYPQVANYLKTKGFGQ